MKKARRWLAEARSEIKLGTVSQSKKRDPKKKTSLSRCVEGVRKRQMMKCLPGRGRKRAKWVTALYEDLAEEFRLVRKAGAKVNGRVLADIARNMITKAPEGSLYHASVIDPVSTLPIERKISSQWVTRFCDTMGIVCRSQTGKLMTSPAKQLEIDISVVQHLAILKHEFDCGVLDENLCYNMDETAFHINMDDSKTLDWRGVVDCKYHDVTSGGQNFTLMVHISGGRRGTLEPGFVIFQNASSNYPIRGCPDNVPGVSYRTGPKRWMDARVFLEMLWESRFLKKDPHGRQKVVFIDNVASHNATDEEEAVLRELNIVLRYLPPNSTHLTQPADSFVIQAIKSAWMEMWDKYKFAQISKGEFRDGPGQAGHIPNPQKRYFLELAAASLAAARQRVDSNGLNFARKSMIRCGLSLPDDGVWKISQLRQELQTLVTEHRDVFDKVYDEEKKKFLAQVDLDLTTEAPATKAIDQPTGAGSFAGVDVGTSMMAKSRQLVVAVAAAASSATVSGAPGAEATASSTKLAAASLSETLRVSKVAAVPVVTPASDHVHDLNPAEDRDANLARAVDVIPTSGFNRPVERRLCFDDGIEEGERKLRRKEKKRRRKAKRREKKRQRKEKRRARRERKRKQGNQNKDGEPNQPEGDQITSTSSSSSFSSSSSSSFSSSEFLLS